MSRHGTILPIPADAKQTVASLEQMWADGVYAGFTFPRAVWLTHAETELRFYFPQASSRDLNVTARSLAPFPLAEPDKYRT